MYMPPDFDCFPNFPRCDYCNCFYGMGLAGRGSCPGLWWWNNCPEFRDNDEYLDELREE